MKFVEEKALNIYQILGKVTLDVNSDHLENLMDNFISVAAINDDYTFSSGLLGAGWLISYLDHQGKIKENLDELLFDFDDNIYKIAIRIIVRPKVRIEELMELICYYQQRTQNRMNRHFFFRSFVQIEILKLLTAKLIATITAHDIRLTKNQISISILKLSYLIMTSPIKSDIERVFYEKIEFLIDHYKSLNTYNDEKDFETLYYLYLAARQYNNPFWVTQIEQLLALYTIEYNQNINSMKRVRDIVKLEDIGVFPVQSLDLSDSYFIFFLVSNLRSLTLNK